MYVYPIFAISTEGVQSIRDNWDTLTPNQRRILQDYKNQLLRFKTLNYQGKTWRIFAGCMKLNHLSKLENYLGNNMIVWRCWLRNGKNYHLEYDENGDGIGNPVYDNPKNWATNIAEERRDADGNPIPFADNQDALNAMPVIFGQRQRQL